MKREERYDSLIRYYVEHERERQGPDADTWPTNLWLLVKEQCRAESAFDPNAGSAMGAVGLMQLMPETAIELGVRDRRNPEESIRAGVEYLVRHCWRLFKREQGMERWCFSLAGYNAGNGNIVTAQALCEERRLDSRRWSSITQVLRHVTGESNAKQTIDYVAKIIRAYEGAA